MAEVSVQRSRVDHLESEAMQELLDARRSGYYGLADRLARVLPGALTLQEIESVGAQVGAEAENRWPSKHGSNARASERDIVFQIGMAAAATGDDISLENAIAHLKTKKHRTDVIELWFEKRRMKIRLAHLDVESTFE